MMSGHSTLSEQVAVCGTIKMQTSAMMAYLRIMVFPYIQNGLKNEKVKNYFLMTAR